jgi:hypothetical protein
MDSEHNINLKSVFNSKKNTNLEPHQRIEKQKV